MNKADYVEMLNERVEYLKKDIDWWAKRDGATAYTNLLEIKISASILIGIVDSAKELYEEA